MSYFFKFIELDTLSATPKYLQIANSIIKAVISGKLQDNDILPSINEFSSEMDVSRDTIEKGYSYLKKIGILASIAGKGYFIKNSKLLQFYKIFLLFNKLSTHKKIIYDSFIETLGQSATVDFYIYNNDFNLFKELLSKSIDNYTHYVIIPHLREDNKTSTEILKLIPAGKLILLDKNIDSMCGNASTVYENFEQDIYNALEEALPHLNKYHTIKIIFPNYTYHPNEILNGFARFCSEYAFNHTVIDEIEEENIEDGIVYISLMEDNLVTLIEKIIDREKVIGKDVGVISYNETPLKKIILNGITTISTDFKLMGEKAAEIILNKEQAHYAVPFQLTLRNSL
ncbi:MAG: GntR family transcriptional regulator [Hydrotalea flava]|uniref:GntR family transcriptional regulator n=2 Tax=Hydrotalea TaxID=1004300 RepID=UPI00094563A6|nr:MULTISPECIES: GntR family transcriptional regulator [unclassified Hydrotalea]MBY0346975.1 GntR family transcriptional regulator [Hydrotalea flava]RWZ86085.1 MAG: GntR family transcriptional regulator [Hydrotalea sp. AMD]